MRTFVFISDIPDFILQPTYTDSTSGDGWGQRRNAKRDPRYERLRRLLADHSAGVMLVMHLETKGYGLALYASEEEALDACRADITPEQPGMQYPPLKLRIVEKEKPLPPEPVYTPNIRIEGEEVLKASLAVTRGLDLAYRGRSVPRWCPSTLEGKDCPFGMNCHRIHKAAVQRTVRKRPRIDDDVDGDDGNGTGPLSAVEAAKATQLVSDLKAAEEVLVPRELRVSPSSLYVPVSLEEVASLLGKDSEVAQSLTDRVTEALEKASKDSQQRRLVDGPFFVRLSFPGGAPWEWALHSDAGMRALKARCPLPANGAPTPLGRDIMCQQLFYHMNRLNAFTSVGDALHALSSSAAVAQGFASFRQQQCAKRTTGTDTEAKKVLEKTLTTDLSVSESSSHDTALHLVVRPWLCLPTVGCEVSAFLEKGGRRLRGVVQRYGQLRLMLPCSALAEAEDTSVNHVLERFVIVGAGQDETAESALEEETRRHTRLFARAVDRLRRHIAAQEQKEGSSGVPANAAWCAQLAIECSGTADTTAAAAPLSPGAVAAEERVVVLSYKPYHQALEECSMYTHLTSPSGGGGARTGGSTDISWNVQKHAYVPLFSREVFERLKQ